MIFFDKEERKVMKKMKVFLATMVISMLSVIPVFAGEWRQSNGRWWYENEDGGYPASQWQEIGGKHYYFGADGYMLENTVTPDGYQVGADGAWIENPKPEAPYYQLLSDPLFYGGAPDYLGDKSIFLLLGYGADLSDCGSYYELNNIELDKYKVYDTEKEARKSSYYNRTGGEIERLSDGRYIVHDDLFDYDTVTAYVGPIYINKDVVVKYYDHTDSSRMHLQHYTCTLEEYFARSGSIEGTTEGYIRARVDQVDSNGYVTIISLLQAG